jgi:polysaccharide biosynthesis/export protein
MSYKKLNINFLRVVLLVLVFSSCTPQKKLIYFQNTESGTVVSSEKFTYLIRSGDVLSVNVYSANEKVYELMQQGQSNRTFSTDMSVFMQGFVVTDSGYVNMPLVGRIYIAGQNLENATETIQEKFREFFFDAIVDIKIINFTITILGEVNQPGTYRIYDAKINVLEALGLAGDLNVYGKRDITLIREHPNGHIMHKIDLKDKNITQSDYFYLLPNDIIYVEPHKAKSFGFNTVPIATLLSTISTFILILNFIK